MIQTEIPFVGVPAGPGGTAFGSDHGGTLDLDLLVLHRVDRPMSLEYSPDIDSALQALANAAEPADDEYDGGYLYTEPLGRFRGDSVSSGHSLEMYMYPEGHYEPDGFDLMNALSALAPDVEYAPTPFPFAATVSPTAITKPSAQYGELASYSLAFPFPFDPARALFPADAVPALSVDSTLERLKLEHLPTPDTAADIQSYIRCVVLETWITADPPQALSRPVHQCSQSHGNGRAQCHCHVQQGRTKVLWQREAVCPSFRPRSQFHFVPGSSVPPPPPSSSATSGGPRAGIPTTQSSPLPASSSR